MEMPRKGSTAVEAGGFVEVAEEEWESRCRRRVCGRDEASQSATEEEVLIVLCLVWFGRPEAEPESHRRRARCSTEGHSAQLGSLCQVSLAQHQLALLLLACFNY